MSRDEARAAVTAVLDNLDDRDWSGYSVSVGKWRSEDPQTGVNVQCVYSVNIESWDGVYGRSWCVGENERDGELEVVDEFEWVITLREPIPVPAATLRTKAFSL